MHPNPFPEIKTERLTLRRLKESDWEMICYLRSDETVNQFVKRPNADTKEKALEFIKMINDNLNNNISYYWCICETGKEEMIGSLCLWNFSEDRKKAEVGYDLSPAFHKMGIMNEAIISILDFSFNRLNLEKIEAFTHWNNESSKKLLERNGFVLNEHKRDEEDKDNLIYEIKAISYETN